jgi:streptomycin 6-kinase
MRVDVPGKLADCYDRYFGAAGRAWIEALPGLAADMMGRWQLRPDGPAAHGHVALVLPVVRADGSPAALKLQLADEETTGEPVALRAWDGTGAVRLLDHDAASGSMLLERLDAGRSLAGVRDDLAALQELSEILVRLNAVPAPAGIRRLSDVASAMLDRVPAEALARDCAAALAEVLPDRRESLLHWDLHYENVLARPGDGTWVAIDPKPLAGDPGFELLAALHNRWADVVAGGDVRRAVRRRFDLMTEVLGLDRHRARAWTLARVLQQLIWNGDDDAPAITADRAIAETLLER